MWNLVCLWRTWIILLISRAQVPTIKIETHFFHKAKAGFQQGFVKTWCNAQVWGLCFFEDVSFQQRTVFLCAFGSSAMNSSFWASDTTHFTCTLSESMEAFWRVWKHTLTYGVIILCGNIAPSCLFWKVLSPVFAQKVVIHASVSILEILCMGMLFTSLCRECFKCQCYRKWNPCRVNWVIRFGNVDV